jgi:hypothetical protein
MKYVILPAIVALLSGCVVTPVSGPHSRDVIVYPPVRVEPSVEIVYIWDPVLVRWFWLDRVNSRHYMSPEWRHPHGYRHDQDRRDDRRDRR